MPIQVLCPNPQCQKALSVSDDLAGQGVRCPFCQTAFPLTPSISGGSRLSGASPAPPMDGLAAPRADMPAAIGPYQVREKLGQGSFGVVYRGYDPDLGREVAIKVLRPEASNSPKYVERFRREAKAVAQMMHGNIVPVYQWGQHGDGYFIASAFIPGRTLAEVIPENGLDPSRAVRLVVQLLEALAYAHDRGVLHRDVKPSNAILDGKDTLYLVDFGLAGLVGQDEGRMTQEDRPIGTPACMSPEQARGAIQEIGPASDLYSAGVVLYELLTGHLPFEGAPLLALYYNVIHTPPPPPSEWRPDLDLRLEQICLKALAKSPNERFGSCRAFADALRAWLADTHRPSPMVMDQGLGNAPGASSVGQRPSKGYPPALPVGVQRHPATNDPKQGRRDDRTSPIPLAHGPPAKEDPTQKKRLHIKTSRFRTVKVWAALGLIIFLGIGSTVIIFYVMKVHRHEQDQLYGGIEIGSAGVKATVIEISPDKELAYDYQVILKKSRYTNVVTGMEKTGLFDQGALAKTVNSVQQFFDQMVNENHLPKEKIFIVGSSDLFQAIRNREDRIKKNQADLAGEVEKATGKKMEFIEVSREVPLMINALVKPEERSSSVLIDVGSGATRGGYRDPPSGQFVTFQTPGAKQFEERVKAQVSKLDAFPNIAAAMAEKELQEPLRQQIEREPGLLNRKRIYLNGGIVWVMATLLHPQDRKGANVELSATDIDDFYALVHRNPQEFPSLQLPDSMDPTLRKEVEADVARMKDIFGRSERRIAGAEVLKALSAEFQFHDKELWYTRDGDDAWLLSYLGESYIRDKGPTKK